MTGRVHAVQDAGLGNTSYVVDVGDGRAVVVDPRRDIEVYEGRAAEFGLQVVGALETHLHADFVSGSRELAECSGAQVVASSGAGLGYPHGAAAPGGSFCIGDLLVEVLATPGHTPEHVAYRVTGRDIDAVFSGGSLINGGAARTDLVDPRRTRDLAIAQCRSLRLLDDLPDDTAVYPTHGAGSFCSAGPAAGAVTTIGEQRLVNPLLGLVHDEDAFAEALIASYGTFPHYFRRLRPVNRRPSLRSSLEPAPALEPREVADMQARGVRLVDARSAAAWACGHPVGAVSNACRPQFGTWLGWLVEHGRPWMLLAASDGDATEALRQASVIGYDSCAGVVRGGFDAWVAAGLPATAVPTVDPAGARALHGRGAVFLDVRQSAEVAAGRIPGAMHIELGTIIDGVTPAAREVVTYCGHGERSATAASLLEARGLRVANMAGGVGAWERAGLPLTA